LPDNELTAQMSGEVRADNTRDLLVHLLQQRPDRFLKPVRSSQRSRLIR
jgi:hypothetical protein